MNEIKFIRFNYKATAPKHTTIDPAGYELYSAEKVTIKAKSVNALSIDIGIQNTLLRLVGKIYSRSSLSMKMIEVGGGVTDAGFRGVIYVVLHNHSDKDYTVDVADRIARIFLKKFQYLF